MVEERLRRMHPSSVAIITARGGSKAIEGKNVRPVGGNPLIAWSIQAALNADSIDRVIVSTDDETIAEISQQFGADVPFLRPTELAQDDSPHIPVLLHAIDWLLENERVAYDYVFLLQPTSPLRSSGDIDDALQLALEKGADSVVSVCEALSHPQLVKRISEDGRLLDPIRTSEQYMARQTLPSAYVLNGAIYLARCEVLRRHRTFYTSRTYALVMPQERSLDIDTSWHLHLADLLLRGGERST